MAIVLWYLAIGAVFALSIILQVERETDSDSRAIWDQATADPPGWFILVIFVWLPVLVITLLVTTVDKFLHPSKKR